MCHIVMRLIPQKIANRRADTLLRDPARPMNKHRLKFVLTHFVRGAALPSNVSFYINGTIHGIYIQGLVQFGERETFTILNSNNC